MKKALIHKEEVSEYLPQQEPMIMVDCLLSIDDTKCSSSFLVLDTCICFFKKRLSEAGIMENMAQTAALKMGYLSKQAQLTQVPVGYIGAISRFKLFSFPLAGELLLTEMEILGEFFGVQKLRFVSYVADRQIAECEMKIGIIQESDVS